MQSHTKLWLWLVLAAVFTAVAVGTAVAPQWLESFFGLDADGGDGSAEWLIVIGSGTVSAISWSRAAMRIRLAR